MSLGTTFTAQKNHLQAGDLAFYNEKFVSAIDSYKKAEVHEKSGQKKGEINFKIALCYAQMLDIEQAEVYLSRAEKLKFKVQEPQLLLQMGEVMMQQGEYKNALALFNEYLTINPNDSWVQTKIYSCEEQLNNPARPEDSKYIFQNEIQLNTEYYDYSLSFADKKKNAILFASTRPGNYGTNVDDRTGQSFSDIWISTRDNKEKWDEPQLLPSEINTEHNEGTPIMNSKGDALYFTRCNSIPKKNVGCDIYYTEKTGNKWSESILIPFKPDGADSLNCGHPAINNKEDLMIFAADLPNGFGGKDLWMSSYDKKLKKWGTPINLGPEINTIGDEVFPYLDSEGHLYFSSNGHIGFGGLDLYKVTLSSTPLVWTNVELLPAPINSSRDDFGIVFESEDRGFITSNRSQGKGVDDIYSFNLKTIKITSECFVMDQETMDPIPYAKITLSSSDNEIFEVTADEQGYFKFDAINELQRYLNIEKNYSFLVSAPEYSDVRSRISTIDLETSKNFVEEFILFPLNKPINLPEVRYDYDKEELQVIEGQVDSRDSLDYLYDLMIEHPGWIVELQAHTDCRGPEAYNLKLSQGRANSCVEYLISKGIPKERLVPVGYGENKPVEGLTCDFIESLPTEDEQEAAHQKNRRTQFKILSIDFKQ